ncbi:TPA: conjugal transfer protein TraH, partial [Escherichia coli]|nr:conjugal transfer protein TraH [Escherichia coli]
MFVRKPLSILCGLLLACSASVSADVNSDMNTFFNKLGFASNTSQPQVWQGQAA